MGVRSCAAVCSILNRISAILVLALMTGCQISPPADLGDRMAAHAANIDSTGLTPGFTIPQLDVRITIPRGWQAMASDSSPLYVHQQWRSPQHNTGVGVVYIHLPLPMSAKALVWLGRTQYSRQSEKLHRPDAQVLNQWTDSLGREWFEGENVKYHVKGYVETSGFNAWAVYSGYRLRNPPNSSEISLAFRSMDSVVPIPLSTEK